MYPASQSRGPLCETVYRSGSPSHSSRTAPLPISRERARAGWLGRSVGDVLSPSSRWLRRQLRAESDRWRTSELFAELLHTDETSAQRPRRAMQIGLESLINLQLSVHIDECRDFNAASQADGTLSTEALLDPAGYATEDRVLIRTTASESQLRR
jgi:hypothetical protein